MLKHLLERVSTALVLQLRKATTADEMQNIINIYMHDRRIGLPRGMPGPMICMTETENKEDARTNLQTPGKFLTIQTDKGITQQDYAINATTKGGKKGHAGKQTWYGQWWECGEWGHPRRGCPGFIKRMGKGNTQDVAALTGNGKYGKGGKWGKGKHKGGKRKRILWRERTKGIQNSW